MVLVVKNPPANAGDKRCGFDPWVRKIPWRRKWQPTPIFLLGKSHAQRSLVGYSPRGRKKSDLTEATERKDGVKPSLSDYTAAGNLLGETHTITFCSLLEKRRRPVEIL